MNEMIKFQFVSHSECTNELLDRICRLKMKCWNYTEAEHRRWMGENLFAGDIHLLLYIADGEELVAYMNLVRLTLEGDGIAEEALGIGNVCVNDQYRGKEYGYLAMKIAEFKIKQEKKSGVLLCKDNLVPFYEKCGWQKFVGKVLLHDHEYQYNVFVNPHTDCKKISLDRNF